MDENELELRKQLWLGHGCYLAVLYGDDGEMQCNHCMIDFKCDSLDTILLKLNQVHIKDLAKKMTVEALEELLGQIRLDVYKQKSLAVRYVLHSVEYLFKEAIKKYSNL